MIPATRRDSDIAFEEAIDGIVGAGVPVDDGDPSVTPVEDGTTPPAVDVADAVSGGGV